MKLPEGWLLAALIGFVLVTGGLGLLALLGYVAVVWVLDWLLNENAPTRRE